jgi:hypothetical protein
MTFKSKAICYVRESDGLGKIKELRKSMSRLERNDQVGNPHQLAAIFSIREVYAETGGTVALPRSVPGAVESGHQTRRFRCRHHKFSSVLFSPSQARLRILRLNIDQIMASKRLIRSTFFSFPSRACKQSFQCCVTYAKATTEINIEMWC